MEARLGASFRQLKDLGLTVGEASWAEEQSERVGWVTPPTPPWEDAASPYYYYALIASASSNWCRFMSYS